MEKLFRDIQDCFSSLKLLSVKPTIKGGNTIGTQDTAWYILEYKTRYGTN